MIYRELSANKFALMTSIMHDDKDGRFFKELDTLLLNKRFDNAYELSLTESVLHISSCNLTFKNIRKIMLDCIKALENPSPYSNSYKKRNLYEIAKLSNLPKNKLNRAVDIEMQKALIHSLDVVSHETKFISYDFLILRILDNFMLKNDDAPLHMYYKNFKTQFIEKIVYFEYLPEKKEKETSFLCWIDRILYSVINKEINTDEFIALCQKVFSLTSVTIYTYWKVLHSVNYLLLQPEFNSSLELKNFKKELFKTIGMKYNATNTTIEDVKNLAISTLAKMVPNKEDYYYLFDTIKQTAVKSEENKFYCLRICKYLIEHNSKQNVFCFRFIRKYFIDTLFEIINNPLNNIKIKDEELAVLTCLFHVDTYFCFNRVDIFKSMITVLKSINNGDYKPTYKNFYRYCSVIDYIMSENPDLKYPDIIDFLSHKKSDREVIASCFKLLLEKNKKNI